MVDTVRDACATGFFVLAGSRGVAGIVRRQLEYTGHRSGEYSHGIIFQTASPIGPEAMRYTFHPSYHNCITAN